jgi:hypothetical protein
LRYQQGRAGVPFLFFQRGGKTTLDYVVNVAAPLSGLGRSSHKKLWAKFRKRQIITFVDATVLFFDALPLLHSRRVASVHLTTPLGSS